MLNVLITMSYVNNYKRVEEAFGGDGHVYGIDYGDGFLGAYLPSNSY